MCGSGAAGGGAPGLPNPVAPLIQPLNPDCPQPDPQPQPVPGGPGIPVRPGGAFAVSGVLVGKDANRDGVIERNEMGFIATGGAISGGGGGGGFDDDCGDCVRTVTTFKTVQVPCTRNRYKVVNYTVPQTVPYTDYETVTRTRTVTKQIPKTILVPTSVEEPYQTQVPVTKYRTITVNKSRTECTPETKIVSRQVPVVTLVPKPPPPCPPQPQPIEPDCKRPMPLPEPLPQPVPY